MPPHDINISWDPEMELGVITAECSCSECTCVVNIIATVLEHVAENVEIV